MWLIKLTLPLVICSSNKFKWFLLCGNRYSKLEHATHSVLNNHNNLLAPEKCGKAKRKIAFNLVPLSHLTLQINALFVAALNSDCFIDDAFVLLAAYNKCVNLTKTFKFGNSARICNNSFVGIYLPPSRIDIKYIIQVLSFGLFCDFRCFLVLYSFFTLICLFFLIIVIRLLIPLSFVCFRLPS